MLPIDPAGRPEYPPVAPGDTVDRLGGRDVPDPYRALEDADAPATREWSAGQRRLFDRLRDGWPAVDAFRAAMTRLTAFEQLTSPQLAGGLAFFTVRGPADEHPALAVADPSGSRRILFDPHRHDPTGRTVLGGWTPDPTGALVAVQTAEGGAEEYTLRVLEVATGRTVDGPITGCPYGNVAWSGGPEAFYHVRGGPAGRGGARLYLHRIGEHPADDTEVPGATAPADRPTHGADADDTGEAAPELDVLLGADGRLLVAATADGLSSGNRVRIADLALGAPEKPDWRPLTALDGGWSSPGPPPTACCTCSPTSTRTGAGSWSWTRRRRNGRAPSSRSTSTRYWSPSPSSTTPRCRSHCCWCSARPAATAGSPGTTCAPANRSARSRCPEPASSPI